MNQEAFWNSDDKLPIKQTSVSIPTLNGGTFSGGQRIQINIPSNVEYIQPRESYLKFDFKLKLPTGVDVNPTYLQLDEVLGGQSLIKDIRIYSGGAGKILLEEIQDYNCLTNIKYTYESNDVLRQKRALTEGSTCHSVANRATLGTTTSHKNSTETNPYFKHNTTDKLTDDHYQTVKCLLPLNTGLFSSGKVLPVLLTEGLVLDIILEDSQNVFRQLDQVSRFTKLNNLPVFHSIDGLDPGGGMATGVAPNTIYLTQDNSMRGLKNCPFCIGERIGFVSTTVFADPANEQKGPFIAPLAAAADEFIITGIRMGPAAGANINKLIEITCSGKITSATATQVPAADGTWSVFSQSVSSSEDYGDVSYTLSNVEMVCQQLEMPQGYTTKMMSMMKEGGSMNYDFLSFTNFKYSQLSGDLVSNIRLPLNMTKAKAILSVPTDAQNYTANARISGKDTYEILNAPKSRDRVNTSQKSGLVGVSDFITDYQFFYDGKLNPSRKVNCSKTSSQVSISQQQIIELEKALVMSNITPFSFKGFNDNFVIGRALSLHNGIYDTRGRDFNLQVEYLGQGNAIAQKNKLWMNFVSHIRTIQFKGDGISLLV